MAGRKKIFDEATALEVAMNVFWEKGYIGASLADLTQRMGINKPSLYSAFGNKESLFIRATKLYAEKKIKNLSNLLNDRTIPLKERIKTYMMSIVSVQCESKKAKGCYLVLCEAEVASGELPEQACHLLIEAGNYVQTLLETILVDDDEAKILGLNKKAKMKALCLASTLRGTASMARCGHQLSELESIVDHSLIGIGLP